MDLTVNIKELKQQFGDAFYVLDSARFKNNYKGLKEAFSSLYSNFNIAYSYKTNYIPKLCKIVNSFGGYAEVVSDMEMELALKVGVNPQKIIWNGPIKDPVRAKELLLAGGVVNIDSIDEMNEVERIASSNNKIINIGIRCNFDVGDGVVSRFGFDVEGPDFPQAISFALKTKNVRLCNLQCHFAKRQINFWPARVKGMIKIIDDIGFVPNRIDLGGALFGKMANSLKRQFNTEIPTYSEYANTIVPIFVDRFGKFGPELVIEPGTAVVGDCMQFVCTVKSIKNIRGKNFATVFGSQKNISMTGVNPPIRVIHTGENQKKFDDIDFTGYTCIENDVIYKNYSGDLAVGDTLVIGNCGSYSLVMKPPFILPNFPVIDISEEKIEVIKRAENFQDVFQTYNF